MLMSSSSSPSFPLPLSPVIGLDLGLWLAAIGCGSIFMAKSFSSSTIRRPSISALFRISSRGDSRFAFLDIFRFVALCWVVINHLGSEGRLDILRREQSGEQFKQSVHSHPIFGALLGNSALGVEIFLLLSGLLAAHSWHRHWNGQLPFWRNAFSFLFRRWLRLAPPVIAFVLLAISPVSKWAMPQFHFSMASVCTNRQILSHALFINNWHSVPTCFGWLWYLGLDWQCYLMGPFLLHLLAKMPKTGLAFVSSLIVGSIFLRGWHCRTNGICNNSDVDIPFVYFPDLQVDSKYSALFSLYARPTTKLGPFLIGLLIGVFTLRKDEFVFDQSKSTKLFVGGLALALVVIYGILPEYFDLDPDQGNTFYNTIYTATFRTAFVVAIGMMVISVLGRNNPPSISPIWAFLAELTFSAFLVHMPVVFLFNHVTLYQKATSVYGLLFAFPPALLFTLFVAFIFHNFVESPLSRLFSFKNI